MLSSWSKTPQFKTNDRTELSLSAGKEKRMKSKSRGIVTSMDDRVQDRLNDMTQNSNPDEVSSEALEERRVAHQAQHKKMLNYVNSTEFDPTLINKRDKQGFTLLHLSTMNDWYDVSLILINKGSDPGVKDFSKRTALDWAYIIKDKLHISLLKDAMATSQTNNTETVVSSPR